MTTKVIVNNLSEYLDLMVFKGEDVRVKELNVSFPTVVEIPITPDGHEEMTYTEFDDYRYFYGHDN